MEIFPAIDIKDGRCVRLFKGDFSTAEQVAEDYMATAKGFKNTGSAWIHMVDLDGAKGGKPANTDIFLNVAAKSGLKLQLGGGIRSLDTVEMYLSGGVSRVILGSAAVNDPELVKTAVKEYGDKIAVGIDAKNGLVKTSGWLEKSNVGYVELGVKMAEMGVKYFIFTDIDKDGTLSRPNHFQTKTLSESVSAFGASVIASGGIRTLNNLITLRKNGIYGAILGKSIYNKTIDLEQAIRRVK